MPRSWELRGSKVPAPSPLPDPRRRPQPARSGRPPRRCSRPRSHRPAPEEPASRSGGSGANPSSSCGAASRPGRGAEMAKGASRVASRPLPPERRAWTPPRGRPPPPRPRTRRARARAPRPCPRSSRGPPSRRGPPRPSPSFALRSAPQHDRRPSPVAVSLSSWFAVFFFFFFLFSGGFSGNSAELNSAADRNRGGGGEEVVEMVVGVKDGRRGRGQSLDDDKNDAKKKEILLAGRV